MSMKPESLDNILSTHYASPIKAQTMKTIQCTSLILLAAQLSVASALAQGFKSDSTGADGPLDVSTDDRTLDIPDNGVFNFTTITVGSNRTLRFRKNSRNL